MREKKPPFYSLIVFALLVWIFPSAGEAKLDLVTCTGSGTPLQDAINKLKPGDTLFVSGTCKENVVINESKERVMLAGGGRATIDGPDPLRATVRIRGKGITITGFTITGGEDGINVHRNASVLIAGNNIQNTGRHGIAVVQNAVARITANVIINNPLHGVTIVESSSARLGFLAFDGIETIPVGVAPNTIQNNGGNGVNVTRSSSAVIIDNVIQNNTEDGVNVARVSHANIARNTINNNGQNGINVSQNSGVNLGEDTGTNLDELPNITFVNNVGFGINCGINSYANGRLGTLNGAGGATSFAGSCVDSLIP